MCILILYGGCFGVNCCSCMILLYEDGGWSLFLRLCLGWCSVLRSWVDWMRFLLFCIVCDVLLWGCCWCGFGIRLVMFSVG